MKITTALLAAVLIAVTVVDGKKAFRQGIKVTGQRCTTWPPATATTAAEYKLTDLTQSEFGLCFKTYPDGWLKKMNFNGKKVLDEGLRPSGLLPSEGSKGICNENAILNCCGLKNSCVSKGELTRQGVKFKELLETKPAEIVNALLKEGEDKKTAEAKTVSDAEMACCSLSKMGKYNSDSGTSDGGLKTTFIWQTRAECAETKTYRAKVGGHWGAQVDANVASEADCEKAVAFPESTPCGLTKLKECRPATHQDFMTGECYNAVSYTNVGGQLHTNDKEITADFYSAANQYFVKLDPTKPDGALLCSAAGVDARMVDTAEDDGKVIGPLLGMGVIGGIDKNDPKRDYAIDIMPVNDDGTNNVGTKTDTIKKVFIEDSNMEITIALTSGEENPLASPKANRWVVGVGGSAEPIWILNV